MALYHLFVALALLTPLSSSWCLRTSINVTDTINTIDFSPDGTLVAIAMSGVNAVNIYDTTNYVLQFAYTPPWSTIKAARFSRNGTYLAVGLSSGFVIIINGKSPFSSSSIFSYQVISSSSIFDLALNNGGDKMLVCFSNSNSFAVAKNFASSSPTITTLSIGQNSGGCKWTMNDDAVIIDTSVNAYTFAVPANGSLTGLTFKTKVVSPSSPFTDLAVRNMTLTPVKIVLAGGINSSQANASVFSNSGTGGTTVSYANVPFTNKPNSIISSACYSTDASIYALASTDFKLWVINDSSNI